MMKFLSALMIIAGVCSAMDLVVVQNPNPEGAFCLDGSNPGYYIRKATAEENATKWLMYLNGGGWCYDELDCRNRASTALGSSNYFPDTYDVGGPMLDYSAYNPDFHSWNHLMFGYCDGASFTGDRDDPVDINGKTVYFRGARIVEAVINDIIANYNFGSATDVFLMGGSAGGFGAFYNANRVQKMLPPSVVRYKVSPISGFFPDIANAEGVHVWAEQVAYMFNMQNSAKNADPSCLAKYPNEQYKCMLPEYNSEFINAPLFIQNSLYDLTSIQCIFAGERITPGTGANSNCSATPGWSSCVNSEDCTAAQYDLINSQWADVMKQKLDMMPHKANNGMYIIPCHGHLLEATWTEWYKVMSGSVSLRDALVEWMFNDQLPYEQAVHMPTCVNSGTFCCQANCYGC